MPSPNTPIQKLNLEVLPIEIFSSGFATHSEEILTTVKYHKKKQKGSKVYNGVNRYLGLPVVLFRKAHLEFLFFGATAPPPSGPEIPHSRGF